MTSRPWPIIRWFGFLAVGAAIAIGSGLRYRANDRPADLFARSFAHREDALAAQAPRAWLAQESSDQTGRDAVNDPSALIASDVPTGFVPESSASPPLDPRSPEAERQIAELGAALAGFQAENVQVRTVEDRGSRRFVFSCDVPTGGRVESFVGEGPDPPSAARHALSRIRAWAATPGEKTLR